MIDLFFCKDTGTWIVCRAIGNGYSESLQFLTERAANRQADAWDREHSQTLLNSAFPPIETSDVVGGL